MGGSALSRYWLVLGFASLWSIVLGFDNKRSDNLAVYWGQDSAGTQQPLSFYCQDDTIDVIPLAFLYIFYGKGGMPVIDFANICNQWDNPTFPGTNLADCSHMAQDIKQCQSRGKIVTLSLGGGTGQVGFQSDSQAVEFAETIWDMFLGGNGDIRPFGDGVVLDGVDLDIESGSAAHYAAFVNKIRSLGRKSSKKYYITAAPQCPFPDQNIGDALNEAHFDAVYVQFYNNFCELSIPSEFNFKTWDNWARSKSANPDIRVYIGAPGSQNSAGEGYVDTDTLIKMAKQARDSYSSFGGIMLWDADSSHSNGRLDHAVKAAVRLSEGPSQSSKTSSARTSVTKAASTRPVSSTLVASSTRPVSTSAASSTRTASSTSLTSTTANSIPDPKSIARVHFPSPIPNE